MSRTVTAMFDSRPEAEAAKSRLNSSNIDADRVRIIDKGSPSGSFSSDTNAGESQGFWASLKDLFSDDDDRNTYGEGIERGSFLLCAEVDEDQADEAVRILDESDSVDLDQRAQGWRSEGWTGYAGGDGGFASTGTSGLGTDADSGQSYTGTSAATAGGFGRRDTGRGGPKVRSYVRDTPEPGSEDRSAFGGFETRPTGTTTDRSDADLADSNFRDRDKSF